MKKNKWLLCAAASVLMLGACAQPGSGETTNAELTGTVSFTFKSDYEITVNPLKGKETFEHDVTDTVTAELDLTAGQLYAHVKRDGKDNCIAKKGDTTKTDVLSSKEALVYQSGADYYYLTKTMGDPVKLASEAEALAKIDELLISTSALQSGDVSLSTLLYEGNLDYEWKQITLGAESLNDDPEDPAYRSIFTQTTTETETGKKVAGTSKYVGLKGDTGAPMDYEGNPAVTYTIEINKDNYVTKLDETIDSQLVMHLSATDNPTVNYKGTRKLAATYGEAITKLATIEHEQAFGEIKSLATPYGEVEIFNVAKKGDAVTAENKLAPNAEHKLLAPVASWLAIKVTTPNKINSVNNNTNSTLKAEGGYYWLEVVEGANDVSVAYGSKQLSPNCPVATLTIVYGEGVEFAKTDAGVAKTPYFYHWSKPMQVSPLFGADHNVTPAIPGYFVAFPLVEPEAGKIYKFTVGDKTLAPNTMGGVYSVEFQHAGEYELHIDLVNDEKATVKAPLAVSGADVYYKYAAKSNPQKPTDITINMDYSQKLTAGDFLIINVKAHDGNTVDKVAVNGNTKPAQDIPGVGKIFMLAAGENKVEITVTGTALDTEAKYTYAATQGVESLKVQYFTLGENNAPVMGDVIEPNTAMQIGKMIMVMPQVTKGTITIVRINGMVLGNIKGMYWFVPTSNGVYNITVETIVPQKPSK